MSNLQATVVNQASLFPGFARRALNENPIPSNLFLPGLSKYVEAERRGQLLDGLWIIIHVGETVKFILSSTDGPMGKYPLFFFTPLPYNQLRLPEITPSLNMAAQSLFQNAPVHRVYSIFAPEIVCRTFARIWSNLAHVGIEQDPYYHAKISYLERATLVLRGIPLITGAQCELRPGLQGDIRDVAELCYRFAEDSPPFTLTREAAHEEARLLIRHRQLWVYSVVYNTGHRKIASIVATTRNTATTATITKVFTDPGFRGRGCAERLVGLVCQELLNSGRRYVVLYVGIDNKAANVYRKVGFVGIGENAPPAPGVETWMELGFQRNMVQLGHW